MRHDNEAGVVTTPPATKLVVVARSELLKLRALRSIVWLTVSGALLVLFLGPLQGLGQIVARSEASPVASVDAAVQLALTGMGTACLVFGIAGILVVTTEYQNRAVRTTFTVVPRRGLVVAAKAGATAGVVGTAALVSAFAAVLVTRPLLAEAGADLPLDLSVLRVIAGAALYAITWAVLGQALGWLVRSTVGATMSLIGVMYVLPALVTLLPEGVAAAVYPYLPSQAAAALLQISPGSTVVPPLLAAVVVAAYLLLALVASGRWVSRRDA
ncbi:MAG TPA: hypothetical protein VER39_16200 [Nocardioidaceae bacterium]|nr:hypothetical protein [Nocardioidaceae bacterium]